MDWLRSTFGRGEGSSGLAFDTVEETRATGHLYHNLRAAASANAQERRRTASG